MTEINRLDSGGNIDRTQKITFTFNGKSYTGYQGDTVASALLASGVNIVARSFKYRRPRGIMAAGVEEPNAVLQLGKYEATQVPNILATQQEIYEGLTCRSVTGWPSCDVDFGGLIGRFMGKMLPPGFYYKTFMKPAFLWHTYEKYIRKAAGLGRSPKESDADRYDHVHHNIDVLIVGAGPAGLIAATRLSAANVRIMLAEETTEMGGSLLSSQQDINGKDAKVWVKAALKDLQANPDVRLLTRATVNGFHDHNFVTVNERVTDHLAEKAPTGQARQILHKVRCKWIILASGAHERPLVFGNNDVPGCMTASAISTYIHRYGVIPGSRLVLMTNNDNAYHTAIDWYQCGRTVIAVVDTRPNPEGKIVQKVREMGINVFAGKAVIDVRGRNRVTGVVIADIEPSGQAVMGMLTTLDCDTVASSGGWSPVVHLSCHTGCRPKWREDIQAFVPGSHRENILFAGSVNGHYDLANCLQEAVNCADQIILNESLTVQEVLGDFKVESALEEPIMPLFSIPHTKPVMQSPKQFVDFQNDVTVSAIDLAVREGFHSIEHVKRYTVMGFGTDQGKLGNINGMAIVANALDKSIPEVGTTTFRPNYTPVAFGTIVGRYRNQLFDPERYTAMHRWHCDNGALFEDVGQWKRPWYFQAYPGEKMQDALNRECLAVRQSVGIMDASTLGKIDIQGKDAREFLGRVYTNAWAKLAVGKCRYGVMCNEDGMVFDDGVTACLAEQHFLMTTTTGGAAKVLEWLELFHQTEWPELDVYFNSVTDHWATIAINGPNARKLLSELCEGIDLDKDKFKLMDWRQGIVAGVPARVFRISFTGELSFEINVQANYGMHVWKALQVAGKKYKLTPYGTETMHVLRAEKGFIIAGQDTDGSVTPLDLGMDWCLSNKKSFSYIGKRGMARSDCLRKGRKQLVGIQTKSKEVMIPEGSQAVDNPYQPLPLEALGHITSSYFSANLNQSIAMGFIKDGFNRMGDTVYYPQPDGTIITAEICSPVFYDPNGDKQHVE
ncbi:MAG: sarcosine oxidase subunit alpha family protein [Cellvibrionales bacterium]|nr:sarcosine oxidase subunit alpha family protein [Cellvibrionales bacterium]